jgi:hypothetical protein
MKRHFFGPFLVILAMSSPAVAESPDAQTFQQLKGLAGIWTGEVTTVPAVPDIDGHPVLVSIRATSRGNAVLHEIAIAGLADDPITMFYLDGDRLTLTHYCDAGNRPRMLRKPTADAKALEFEFADLAGGDRRGHMHGAAINLVDDTHHTEDWTFLAPNGASVRAHFNLRRMHAGPETAGTPGGR